MTKIFAVYIRVTHNIYEIISILTLIFAVLSEQMKAVKAISSLRHIQVTTRHNRRMGSALTGNGSEGWSD